MCASVPYVYVCACTMCGVVCVCVYLRGRRVRLLRRVGHLLQLGEAAGRRPAAVVLLLLLERQVAALVPARARSRPRALHARARAGPACAPFTTHSQAHNQFF